MKFKCDYPAVLLAYEPGIFVICYQPDPAPPYWIDDFLEKAYATDANTHSTFSSGCLS